MASQAPKTDTVTELLALMGETSSEAVDQTVIQAAIEEVKKERTETFIKAAKTVARRIDQEAEQIRLLKRQTEAAKTRIEKLKVLVRDIAEGRETDPYRVV